MDFATTETPVGQNHLIIHFYLKEFFSNIIEGDGFLEAVSDSERWIEGKQAVELAYNQVFTQFLVFELLIFLPNYRDKNSQY